MTRESETGDDPGFELFADGGATLMADTLEDFRGAYVLIRPSDDDFGPDDMDLARRLLRLMADLYVQASAQRSGQLASSGSAVQVRLTGTESAVLSLLARGYTARRIAGELSNSPRTVQKHLEHIYRKLGVSDRLMAVQVAAELGLRAVVHPEPVGPRRPPSIEGDGASRTGSTVSTSPR